MKVLHFYKTYLPDTRGGTEHAIYQTICGTAKHGVQNTVLALSKTPQPPLKMPHHTVHHCKCHLDVASTPLSLSGTKQFSELAAESDLIHFHFPYPYADMLHFLSRHQKPTVVTYHADIIKQKHLLKFYTPLMHRFFSSVDRIIATSPTYLASSPVLHRYRNKVEVIPIGLDQSTYPTANRDDVKKLQLRFGRRFFLFLGVLRYYKGLDTLLSAAKSCGYPVVIAGDGPLARELHQQKAQQGLDNVHFTGFVSETQKAALLEAAYAVVLPSNQRSEAFGISLLEGAMFQKPLISCEIGTGTTYINKMHETGLVVPPNAPAKLAAAMSLLWEHPDYVERMGAEAYMRYRRLFTADVMAERYTDVYERLISARTDETENALPLARAASDTAKQTLGASE